MPATSRPAAGERPAAGAGALLSGLPADGPLARVRRGFLALALLACAVVTVASAGVPDSTAGLRLAGIAAVAALAVVWVRAYRRGALSPFDEPIELLAVLAVGLAVGEELGLAVVYTGLYLRSLYGSRLRAAAGFAVYATAFFATVVADGGQPLIEAAEHLPALAIGCAVMQALAALLGRHERSLRREQILRETGAALVDARDRAGVHAAAMEAVDRLGGGRPVAAVLLTRSQSELAIRAATGPWLPGMVSAHVACAELPGEVVAGLTRGEVVVLDSPRLAGLELYAPPDVAALSGVGVPLVVRGELRGVLAAFGPAVQDADTVGSLATVAGEAALALAALEAADSAADDRSLERLTQRDRGMI
jgi:hypothetical protein